MIFWYAWSGRRLLSLSLSHKATIIQRVKEGYLIWMRIVPHIAKGARYTIGARIENTFLDLLEQTYAAYFSAKEKGEKIAVCILTLDILKFLITVAWEAKLISRGQCEELAVKLEESGRMFGGWRKSLENPTKKNRDCLPTVIPGKGTKADSPAEDPLGSK